VGPIALECSTQCLRDLFLDDFINGQRYSFLNYNALFNPGFTGDDGTMETVTINNGARQLTLVPKANSYFYSQVSCHQDLSDFEGFGFTAIMPPNATFTIEFQSSTNSTLGCQKSNLVSTYIKIAELGYVSNGTMLTIRIPFNRISNFNPAAVNHILFSGFTIQNAPVHSCLM
jgi:hypothetical protein